MYDAVAAGVCPLTAMSLVPHRLILSSACARELALNIEVIQLFRGLTSRRSSKPAPLDAQEVRSVAKVRRQTAVCLEQNGLRAPPSPIVIESPKQAITPNSAEAPSAY